MRHFKTVVFLVLFLSHASWAKKLVPNAPSSVLTLIHEVNHTPAGADEWYQFDETNRRGVESTYTIHYVGGANPRFEIQFVWNGVVMNFTDNDLDGVLEEYDCDERPLQLLPVGGMRTRILPSCPDPRRLKDTYAYVLSQVRKHLEARIKSPPPVPKAPPAPERLPDLPQGSPPSSLTVCTGDKLA